VILAATRDGVTVATPDGPAGWTVVDGLPGEDVRCVAIGSGPRHDLYVGTQGHGIFRSDDRGRSWRPSGLDGRTVKVIAVSPSEAGTLYAGLKPPALAVSRDGGATWDELPAFASMRRWFWRQPAERPHTPYVSALAVSPSDPAVILAGIEAATVLRSPDAGRTWTRHWRGVALDCHAIRFHETDGSRAYVGSGTGASLSLDGGRTWKRHLDGLDRRYGWSVAVDPQDRARWYLCAAPVRTAHSADARAALFRSEGGGSWNRLTGGLPESFPTLVQLAADAATGELYAAQRSGEVWRSGDRGASWERQALTFESVRALAVETVHRDGT
jgi:photosystem II stability/assembly factor-like uncharacterized protein